MNTVVTEELVANLHSLSNQKESESIYLQTSKGIYETEEDVWFKGYVLNAHYLVPSLQSKTLFVQLSNDRTQQIVWKEKFEIEKGFVNGHLFLTDTLSSGVYTLKAYSSHSFYNNTTGFFAARKLKIIKKIKQKKEVSFIKKDSTVHFSTFPEGGYLVSGMQSNLAFKAVNKEGEPIAVSGVLYENEVPLFEFKSSHAGMGSFIFTPHIDRKYKLEIFHGNQKITQELSGIKLKGVSLQLVETQKEFLIFRVNQSKSLPQRKVYLRLQIRGEVFSLATANLEKSLKIKIPLKNLPKGIAEVTLFDEEFEPICERLVFVNQEQNLFIKTSLNKEYYKTREKVKLEIKVTDQNKKPVVAHLGLSIFDKLYNNKGDCKNIISHYYLSSNLKGNMYDPSYYFDKKNTNRKEALNLLLLTQGWRRYLWSEASLEELGSLNKQVLFDRVFGTAKLRKKKKNKSEKQPVILVFNPAKVGLKRFIMLDSLGKFNLEPQHLKIGEKSYTYIKLMAAQKERYLFNLQDDAFRTIDRLQKSKEINYPFAKIGIEEKVILPFRMTSDVNKLDEVLIKTKKRKVTRDKYLGKLDSIAKYESTSDFVCKHNYLNCPEHSSSDEESKKPIEGEIYYVLKVWDPSLNVFVEGVPRNGNGFINPPLSPYHYPPLSDAYLLERFKLIRTKGYHGKREFYQTIYGVSTFVVTIQLSS